MRLPEVQTELRRLAAGLRMFGVEDDPVALAIALEHLASQMSRKPRATNAPVASVRDRAPDRDEPGARVGSAGGQADVNRR
jgi:hypothetical protein